MPAHLVAGCWMTITSHESPVPRPPKIANSGQSIPRQVKFGRARKSGSSSGFRARRATIAACATVNESVAPNE